MGYGLFERLRGVDKWPFVQASVTSVEQVSEGGRSGLSRNIFFTYRCGAEDFDGKFYVDSFSSVYEFDSGDTFDIQCNPRKPAQYFCEEAQSLFKNLRLVICTIGIFVAIFAVIIEWFHL
jgi:hypothetical protein